MGKSSKRSVIAIIIGIVVIAGIALAIFMLTSPIGGGDTISSSEKFDNEQVDVNGLLVSEACEKVREKGWTVYAVNGMHNGDVSEVTDCSDSEHKVSKAEYRPEKMFGVPRVTLMFESDKAVESKANGTSEGETSSTPSGGSSSSTTSTASWREVLTEYESWVDDYVEFMKKYNTASDSDKISMMTEYSSLTQKQVSWIEKLDSVDDELTGADLQYYIEVTTRCAQKIAEATK